MRHSLGISAKFNRLRGEYRNRTGAASVITIAMGGLSG